MSMEQKLKEILDEILNEVEQELEEATTTAGVDGYQTPFAFGAGRKKDKRKEKETATQAGYTIAESIEEARRSVVHKAAKKGSFPVTLVVVKNGKVVDQELVKTPEAVPAAFNVIQSKHKGATIHIEDKTGKRLFSESINEAKSKRPVNRWLELKNDESMHPHKKMAMGLKELKYQLREVEKFFNWYNKIKTMNELDSQNYWKRTNNHIYTIKEKLIKIAKTIQEIEK